MRAEDLHLIGRHQARVVVFVTGERQTVALDRVGDETGWRVGFHAVKGIEDRLHIVSGQVSHEGLEPRVVVLVKQGGDSLGRAQIALERRAQKAPPR